MVATWLNYHSSQEVDPLNVEGNRNVGNTNKHSYNCGGYALECFSWYCPKMEDSWFSDPFGFDSKEEAIEKTEKCVEIMLNDFPTMRRVQSLDEVRSDEYAILFRVSSDGDFHYLKRDKSNHWRHKMGNSPVIDTIKKRDIFKKWCHGRYDGPIVISAKKLLTTCA